MYFSLKDIKANRLCQHAISYCV